MEREIRALVTAQCTGRLHENGFVDALLQLEKEKAAAHGLILTASHTYDDWTVIRLQIPGRHEACASFEFEPKSGRFRRVGTPCREADPTPAETVEA